MYIYINYIGLTRKKTQSRRTQIIKTKRKIGYYHYICQRHQGSKKRLIVWKPKPLHVNYRKNFPIFIYFIFLEKSSLNKKKKVYQSSLKRQNLKPIPNKGIVTPYTIRNLPSKFKIITTRMQ